MPDEIDTLLDLVAAQQVRLDRNVPTLGADRRTLQAELDDLEPTWTSTLQVTRRARNNSARGAIYGVILADWNLESATAWIHGPWIDVDDAHWLDDARTLVTAAVEPLPREVNSAVLCGSVQHVLLEQLAADLGWAASEVNHALVIRSHQIATWSNTDDVVVCRDVTDEDVDAIRSMHDTEFPSTYFTVTQLLQRVRLAEHVMLVATDDAAGICGYVAGRIQPDGDGYIDFLAVEPHAQRGGIGRTLVMALARRLIPQSDTQRICLTVRDSNHPARALYESLGFEIDVSIAAYEQPAPTARLSK